MTMTDDAILLPHTGLFSLLRRQASFSLWSSDKLHPLLERVVYET